MSTPTAVQKSQELLSALENISTALREQKPPLPVQEPVAWMHPSGGVLQKLATGLERSTYTIPLYTTPPLPVQPDQEMRHWAEEYECAMKCLDDAGVPKADGEGTSYSLWGRINCYAILSLPAQPPAPLPSKPPTT